MDQLKSVKDKTLEITEDLQNKIATHAQIVGELEKFNKTINRYYWYFVVYINSFKITGFLSLQRNDYTSRILEIVGNIRKQKADIDKVLIDTRELQKEINLITGQLDRQFTVTDDLLFKVSVFVESDAMVAVQIPPKYRFVLRFTNYCKLNFYPISYRRPNETNTRKTHTNYWPRCMLTVTIWCRWCKRLVLLCVKYAISKSKSKPKRVATSPRP